MPNRPPTISQLEPPPDTGTTAIAVAARRRAWLVFAAVSAGIWTARTIAALPGDPLEGLVPSGLVPGGLVASSVLFAAAAMVAGAVLCLPGRAGRAAGFFAAFLLGAACCQAIVYERGPRDLFTLIGRIDAAAPSPLVRVEGRVVGPARRERHAPGTIDALLSRTEPSTVFPLELDTLHTDAGAAAVSGRLNVYASGLDPASLPVGGRVRVLGMYEHPRPAGNPGQPDAVAWSAQAGRVGWLATSAGAITQLETRHAGDRLAGLPLRAMAEARRGAYDALDGSPDRPGSDVMRAMLLGERSPGGRAEATFARTGIAHLLAISGFHLATLTALVVGAVRLTGDRPRLESLVGLAFLAGYVVLVPARTPIVRAALLAGSILVARGLVRSWDRLALLGWIATLLVLARPMDLFTLGFQLTFGITALLLWLAAGRHPWAIAPAPHPAQPETFGNAAWRWTRTLAATSVVVYLVSAPLILYHTGSFNPLTPAAVVATTPLADLVLASGMLTLLTARVAPALSELCLAGTQASADLLAGVAAFFDGLPTYTTLPPVSAAWAVAATGAAMFALVRARLGDPRVWLAAVAVGGWLAIETAGGGRLDRGVAARVDMLDVGDGSCLLVRAGSGAVLWDCGSLTPGRGVRMIPSALRAVGAPRVHTALITHANIDHYGALPDAAPAIGLRRVLVSAPALAEMRAAPPGSAEALLLAGLDRLGVVVEPIARGDAVDLGGAVLEILWPPAEPGEWDASLRARNDRSLVARLDVATEAGPRSVLLTGDIQRPAMLMLLAGGGLPTPAHVLELPHHGSHHEVGEMFVDVLSPTAVLQSTGASRLDDTRWDEQRSAVLGRGGWWRATAGEGAVFAEILDSGEIRSGGHVARGVR